MVNKHLIEIENQVYLLDNIDFNLQKFSEN
jgi:hypothetical protein